MIFFIFYNQVVQELAPMFAVIFRHVVKKGSFPAYWRLADIVPVLKRSPFSDVRGYIPISISPIVSKIFEKIVVEK